MFRHSLRLGQLFGIRVHLNWSVLIIFALIVGNLALGVFPQWHPLWSVWTSWGVAVAAAILFFASLLAHEVAHALVARRYDLPVRSITLFLFGGVADIQQEPETPGQEIAIAAVGPLVSLGLGVVFLLAFWRLAPPLEQPGSAAQTYTQFYAQLGALASVLGWVGAVNILLALFNMIPALPLDGGRIFRALMWWRSGDFKQATRRAVGVARVFAWTLIALGALMLLGLSVPVLGEGLISGIWLILIGWFLGQSAGASYTQLLIDEALEDVEVSRFVRPNALTAAPTLSVAALVAHYFEATEHDSFPVVQDGCFQGAVHRADAQKVDAKARANLAVAELATPADQEPQVGLREPAADALKKMLRQNLRGLNVVEGGAFMGVLFRQDILDWLQRETAAERRGLSY